MQSRAPEAGSFKATVDVVLRVAAFHGSEVPLADLLQLLPEGTTPESVTAALGTTELPARYVLSDGLVVPKEADPSHLKDFKARLNNSLANFATARLFAARLGPRGILTVAVSGSTSYRAASKMDDVDIFCVTNSSQMWVVLTRALLLNRMMRFNNKHTSPVCLSCVMDEDYAKRLFADDQGALFARDALVAGAVRGEDEYRRLIGSSSWMQRYFPKLYWERSSSVRPTEDVKESPRPWARALNLFLFAIVGTFIRSKTYYHNLQLARWRRTKARFQARIGPDHLIYESAKYTSLKKTYDEIQPAQGPTMTSSGNLLARTTSTQSSAR